MQVELCITDNGSEPNTQRRTAGELLTHAEANALAQFVKRVGHSEFRANAASEDEAYLISDAVAKLQRALAGAGFAPR